MADIQKYLDLVTSQHSNRPNFIALLTSFLTTVDDAVSLISDLETHFDLDLATGAQLDTLGEVIGIGRTLHFQPPDNFSPALDDDTYRLILRTKITKNQWDGTTPQIYTLWQNIFTDLQLQVIDHQDMSMTAAITGVISELRQVLIANGYIIPKPTGVAINYVSKTDMPNSTTSSIILSNSVQIENTMTHPPNPVTLAQEYSAMIISQAIATVIR